MFLISSSGGPTCCRSATSASDARSSAPTGCEELPDPAELTRIAEPWRPHRTLACRYLWRSLDGEPA